MRTSRESAALLVSVVDDDESVRDALSSLLRSVGYRCVTFPSGQAFLDSATLRDTRCTVLDVRMPGLSGLDIQLRLHEMECGIPVIFVTGYADETLRTRAMEYGASAFLDKPFEDDELLGAIRMALGNRPSPRGPAASTVA